MKYHQPFDKSDPTAGYIDGNPPAGVQGSIPPAASIEFPQREIVNAIAASGQTPTDSDLTQLWQAMQIAGGQTQSALWHFGSDVGAANALIVNVTPDISSYTDGLVIATIAAADNTGAATINADGRGAANIKRSDSSALQKGDIVGGKLIAFQYDATGVCFRIFWQQADNKAQVHTGTDTGTLNAIVATMSPPVYLYETGALYVIKIGASNGNTGIATANLGPGVKTIKAIDGTDLIGGEYLAGRMLILDYDGTSLQMFSGTSGAPKILSAPRTYFVDPAGSDSNSGLSAGSGNAFRQITKAVSTILSLNMNNFGVTVNVANGAYNPFTCPPLNGSGTVDIVANNTTPANVTIAAATGEAIYVTGNGWTISGMTLSSAGNGAAPHFGCGVRTSAVVSIYNVAFGVCPFAHILSEGNGAVLMLGASFGFPTNFINIVGAAPAFMYASTGIIGPALIKLNFTGTPAFSSAFAIATQSGKITLPFGTITGSATGPRYSGSLNGTFNTNGGGASYYPGDSAGTLTTGAQYI